MRRASNGRELTQPSLRSQARRVPEEFNLLVGVALAFLPGAAWRSRRDEAARERLREVVHAAGMAGADHWPERAAALWLACGDVSDGKTEQIEQGMINRALDAAWAVPVGREFQARQARQAWQNRADIGDGDYEGEEAA